MKRLSYLFTILYLVIHSTTMFSAPTEYLAENSKNVIEVGPFCSSEPYGATLLINRSAAFVVSPHIDLQDSRMRKKDEALLPYPTCAPDGSYATASATIDNKPFVIEYGKLDEKTLGIKLSSSEKVDITLKWRQPFSACKTMFWSMGGTLQACGVAANTGHSYMLDIKSYPKMDVPKELGEGYKPETMTVCHVYPDQPTILVLTVGKATSNYSPNEVVAMLKKASEHYAETQASSEGKWGNFIGAIVKTMNGSRHFSSLDHRIAHCIGRGWWMMRNAGGNDDLMPYFAWDSFFNGNLASVSDKESAHQTIRAILSMQMENGQVPNYSHWFCTGEYLTPNKTNPPVAAMCIWKMHQRWPDMDFLKEVYPKIVKWHEWFREGRSHKDSYLLSWGDGSGKFFEAVLETGWDDTPSFDGGEMDGTVMNVYCVDLCSMWAADAEYLAKMARALGKEDDVRHFTEQHDKMVSEMNQKLWNDKMGLYCNRFVKDNADGSPRFLTRITPLNFYPLICGAPDAKQAKRILAYMHNPKTFWGENIMPTLPYDDPLFHEQGYWHGQIWGPASYLVWQGILRYDDEKHISQYVDRNLELFMRNWNTPMQPCAENYNSINGTVGDDPHYTWGALLPLMGLEALVSVDDNFKPVARKTAFKGSIKLHHIPFGGEKFSVNVDNGKVNITKE